MIETLDQELAALYALDLLEPGRREALDAILSQLPSALTNLVTTSPASDGTSPNANGMRFEPQETSSLNHPVDNPPANSAGKETENTGDLRGSTARHSIQPAETIGIAVWDGRSATMVAAFSGVTAAPEGHQWIVWTSNSAGQDVPLGTLHAPGNANAGVVQIPVPNSGWANGSPNLMITLESTGSLLSVPMGQVLIRTP
jgi:hypothetical protein